ncbi:MAG: hypothetical protein ACO305_05260 [Rubrivivax sp.]
MNPLSAQAQALIDAVHGGTVGDAAGLRDADGWALDAVCLHDWRPARWPGVALQSWRVSVGAPAWATWTLQVLHPPGPGPRAVLVSGDACWLPPPDKVMTASVDAGIALAWFNRTELAADADDAARTGPVFDRFPQARFGALSVWAWGLQRSVDVLCRMEGIDARRVGVVGHSRGGKAALLAGATDARIWLTAANNSGTAGASSSFRLGRGSETPLALAQRFPHWLAPDALASLGAGQVWPADQDVLLASIAPRGLLLTQSSDDRWANPQGLRHVVARARKAWPRRSRDAVRVAWRQGPHAFQAEDWAAVLSMAAALPPIA